VEDPLILQNGTYFLLGDSQGNLSYTIVQQDYTACYERGTLIATASGEVPVETLAIGDILVTASGQCRPIKWIGRRSYAGRFLATSPGVQPVRFHAGSLGDGLPRRDLVVSPEHAMFIEGMLIPARCLVNGVTITKEHGLERVDYFHVELDSHDVILAEGASSETFLDDNSRGAFQNAGEFGRLYPNAPAPGAFCARKVESGPELDAIRVRLDGAGVQEVRIDRAGLHDIIIRPDACAVRLTTEPFFAPGDRRRLGAAVGGLVLDGADIRLDDPRLAAGWHAREGAWRWTDGAALILVAGAGWLAVEVAHVAVEVAQVPEQLAA
jgi:hypothetical protein